MAYEGLNILASLTLLAILELEFIPQTRNGFYCKDPNISHPYTGDTISTMFVLFSALVGPLTFFLIVETLRKRSIKRLSETPLLWYSNYLPVFCILVLVMEILKMSIGKHRPHFLDTCKPDTAMECVEGSFVEVFQCTNTKFSKFFLDENSRSFPSGHAMAGAFMSVVCTNYVLQRLTRNRDRALKLILVVVCVVWAIAVGASRVYDRRHFLVDVMGGALLGSSFGAYVLYLVNLDCRLKR